jgi:pantoate--beta-alanine ligase
MNHLSVASIQQQDGDQEAKMDVIYEGTRMQEVALRWKRKGRIVVLVPTMGGLHDGHLSLLREGRQRGDILVMSLFVNPKQFGPGEGFHSYPRNFESDRQKAASCGVDVLFAPSEDAVYPKGFQTYVEVEEVTRGLCGAHRPGHFRGVCTVVSQLFHFVMPDLAVFGEKDYQQLMAIRRMVQDLHFPVQIIGMPTVRDAQGLAMSSRNRNLSPAQRRSAQCIYMALKAGLRASQEGGRDAGKIVSAALNVLREEPLCKVQYLELRDARTLEPVKTVEDEAVLAVAVYFGEIRLIDNIAIPGSEQSNTLGR